MLGYDRPVQATALSQVEIDIKTGKHVGPMKEIWKGHSGIIPEGPHIYRKDGYYYLLAAEGGTFDGHMLTMARAKDSIWGPYEPCPHNPVIRGDNTVCPLIQRIGHGELVFDDTTGSWWATVLAARSGGRSSFPLGRETFLTSVDWPEGEWPRLNPVEETVRVRAPLQELHDDTSSRKAKQVSLSLNARTVFLRTPALDNYRQEGDKLCLTPANETLSVSEGTMTFLGQRQYQLDSEASVSLLVPCPCAGKSLRAGVAVYKDTNRHFSLYLDIATDGESKLAFEVETIDSAGPQRLASVPIPQDSQAVQLSIKASPDMYELFYRLGMDAGKLEKIGEAEGKILSGNDFTGAVYATFASGSWREPVEFRDFVAG